MVTLWFGEKDENGRRGGLELDTEAGTVLLNGTALPASRWPSLNKRVTAVFSRLGMIEKPTPTPTPTASRFFVDNDNLRAMNKLKRGKVKTAPFPLSLFYDAVITKEPLDDLD